MGGSVAAIIIAQLTALGYNVRLSYILEPMRTGNQAFANWFSTEVSKSHSPVPVFREANGRDKIPRFPSRSEGYVALQYEIYRKPPSTKVHVCQVADDERCISGVKQSGFWYANSPQLDNVIADYFPNHNIMPSQMDCGQEADGFHMQLKKAQNDIFTSIVEGGPGKAKALAFIVLFACCACACGCCCLVNRHPYYGYGYGYGSRFGRGYDDHHGDYDGMSFLCCRSRARPPGQYGPYQSPYASPHHDPFYGRKEPSYLERYMPAFFAREESSRIPGQSGFAGGRTSFYGDTHAGTYGMYQGQNQHSSMWHQALNPGGDMRIRYQDSWNTW